MPADDHLLSEHRSPVGERPGPYRRHHHHHFHHHQHHSRRRLRQKLRIAALIAMGMALALLAWYLAVGYLDDRALGPTSSHRLVQMLRASGLDR